MTQGRTLALAGAAAAAGLALATFQAAQAAERARPAPGRFITVGGIRLHYLDRGAGGPPVVLLHGNGSMVEDWISSGLVERLSRSRRVVAFDRPGFGRSERPRLGLWTPEAQAALLAEAMARLGLERATVVGHSFGTQVALALALRAPRLVGGLVLAGGYYYPTARLDVPIFSPPAIPVVGDAIRYTIAPFVGRLIAGPVIRRLFDPLPVPARFAEEFPVPLTLRPWQIRAEAEDTAHMIPAAMRLSARLGELRVPVAVVAGEEDRIVTTARQSARLHRDLPGSRLRVVPGAGHMVHHAAPELVADEVEGLLHRAAEAAPRREPVAAL
ncbi:alpha/beta fold hydrolase [Falsiroseomonas sp. CW058]|uniref:alpha/beta fold hydrolase n=1 Tax=Falsiroseomonas sp. CW058 TaxID=3388664 RepID=UPI003D31E809